MPTGNFTAGAVFYASDDNTVTTAPSTSFGRARLNDANGAAALAAIGGEASGAAAAAVSAHEGAADPHTGYQKESEKNAANGYPGLSVGSKIVGTQQTYGTGVSTACEGNDSRLSDARTPTAHAASHLPGGGDEVFARQDYTLSNDSASRLLNVATVTLPELANVVATMIRDAEANKIHGVA